MELEIMKMLNNSIDIALKVGLVGSLIAVVWNYAMLFFTYTDLYLKLMRFIKWTKFILSVIVCITIMFIIFLR